MYTTLSDITVLIAGSTKEMVFFLTMGKETGQAAQLSLCDIIFQYLKENHEAFDIDAFYRRYEDHGVAVVNGEFESAVRHLASYHRESSCKEWAQQIQAAKSSILTLNKALMFWSNNAAMKAELRHKAKAASGKFYDDLDAHKLMIYVLLYGISIKISQRKIYHHVNT